jgi:DNA polymerase III epsilon subunit-like protein
VDSLDECARLCDQPKIAALKKVDMTRYLCIDFETNGRPNDRVLPCGAFPTQVSVTAYVPATGEVTHLYDSYIRGAQSLSDWVQDNTPVTMHKLEDAHVHEEVSIALAKLWQEGDTIVAHNAGFDLGTVLPKIAWVEHPFFSCPTICTMREPWIRKAIGKQPSLADLCEFFNVPFQANLAHDATYDTHVLASCMMAAHRDGCAWSSRVRPRPSKIGVFHSPQPRMTAERRMQEKLF